MVICPTNLDWIVSKALSGFKSGFVKFLWNRFLFLAVRSDSSQRKAGRREMVTLTAMDRLNVVQRLHHGTRRWKSPRLGERFAVPT